MILVDNIVSKSIFAGISVSVGAYLFLLNGNPILGCLLLSLGWIICEKLDGNLFTSKSCYVSESTEFRRLFLVLLLNIASAFLFGLLIRFLNSDITEYANAVIAFHLEIPITSVIVGATILGFLMPLICDSIKHDNYLVTLVCALGFMIVPYHCIIESFYYGASIFIYDNILLSLAYLLTMTVFNFVGCNLYNIIVNKSLIRREV